MTREQAQAQVRKDLTEAEEQYVDDGVVGELLYFATWDDIVGYVTVTFNDPRVEDKAYHYDPPLTPPDCECGMHTVYDPCPLD